MPLQGSLQGNGWKGKGVLLHTVTQGLRLMEAPPSGTLPLLSQQKWKELEGPRGPSHCLNIKVSYITSIYISLGRTGHWLCLTAKGLGSIMSSMPKKERRTDYWWALIMSTTPGSRILESSGQLEVGEHGHRLRRLLRARTWPMRYQGATVSLWAGQGHEKGWLKYHWTSSLMLDRWVCRGPVELGGDCMLIFKEMC